MAQEIARFRPIDVAGDGSPASRFEELRLLALAEGKRVLALADDAFAGEDGDRVRDVVRLRAEMTLGVLRLAVRVDDQALRHAEHVDQIAVMLAEIRAERGTIEAGNASDTKAAEKK